MPQHSFECIGSIWHSAGVRKRACRKFSADEITPAGQARADKAVFAHALASGMDVLTIDTKMSTGSFKDFVRRMNRLPYSEFSHWRVPKIEVLHLALHIHSLSAERLRAGSYDYEK